MGRGVGDPGKHRGREAGGVQRVSWRLRRPSPGSSTRVGQQAYGGVARLSTVFCHV